jgi:hypothetical protein
VIRLSGIEPSVFNSIYVTYVSFYKTDVRYVSILICRSTLNQSISVS